MLEQADSAGVTLSLEILEFSTQPTSSTPKSQTRVTQKTILHPTPSIRAVMAKNAKKNEYYLLPS
jgi:hypothetical protein